MSRLALYLLGPPRVYLDGASVGIERRKVLALLTYLAVTAQRHNRDELSELLHGKQDREHARSNLRQTLSLLRNAVGGEQLAADRLAVWLRRGKGVWIDVAEFQLFLENAHEADTRGDLSNMKKLLDSAVKLYRGDFLSGFYLKDCAAFENWQLLIQESLRRRQASALQRLVEIHGAWGHYERAIDYSRRWLALDPLEEAVHRQLMQLHSLAGQHVEALRQYERCRSLLERELGEKPEEETERLRDQIQARKVLPGTDRQRDYRPEGSARLRLRPLPGTAVFLFARITEAGQEQIRSQEARLREAVGVHHGRILEAAGQILCAVFPSTSAAVRAALRAEIPSCGVESELRIVLLAGERPRQLVPSSVIVRRAEMLLEISPASQVLLDEAAAELAGAMELPEGTGVRCLGCFRLKDLGPAQSVHLLECPGLPLWSDKLETLDSRPNNLPTQPTPFIGREKALAAVQRILRSEGIRLLTLTGTGGVGKTRLALQAAAGLYDHFTQGLFFVDLAPIREPAHLVGAVAAVLNLREDGSDEGRSLLETLTRYLGGKRVLLVLDNFEHLLPAAPQVAELLAGCPRLKVLATSREALHLRAEQVFPVLPMKIPSPGQRLEAMKGSEAVRLFADRASAVRPAFELSDKNVEGVAKICSRLDGLPLAIELAATRIRVVSLRTLLTKLKHRLSLLTGGPRDLPRRQQTLRSEIDWSHELLERGERQVFRRLSVFPGGCALDAAEVVCCVAGEDFDVFAALSSLAEKNLVILVEGHGESRFRMLESVREYALERLAECGELADLEARFANYFRRFAERVEPELYGPDQMRWFDRIEEEYDNIRAALTWLFGRGELVDGLRLAGALGWFWFRRARFAEGQHWLELFRTGAGDFGPPGPRAKAAYFLGWLKLCVSSVWGNPEGKRFFEESLRLWREEGDRRGVALSQVWLGWKEGDIERKEGWLIADDSVAAARETGDPWTIAWCLKVAYSHLRREDKDLAQRRAALEESIALARKTEDPFLLSQALNGMGNVFSWIGEFETAEPWYRDSLSIAREIDDSWSILDNIYYLADGKLGFGRIHEAKEMFSEGLRLAAHFGARGYVGWFLGGLYGVARREGRSKRAVRLAALSESILNPESRYDPRFAEELDLKDETAAVEWTIGRSMTLEQAVTYALTDD